MSANIPPVQISLSDLIKSNVEKIELQAENYPFNLPLRISTFEGEKDFLAFIKNCEKAVRGCIEYKLWRNYIRDVLQIQSCAITFENMDSCEIHIHHHIPSLFILIKALVNKRIEQESPFSTFDIALEVIEMHYKNRIGFVNLISSMHEKMHNGYLKIPMELVRGEYTYFIENYFKYLDDKDLDILNKRLAVKMQDCEQNIWTVDNYPGIEYGRN